MGFKICLLVLVFNIASSPIVQAVSEDISNLLDAQFLNITQDINIGAKSLNIDPKNIDIVRVCSYSKLFHELNFL